MQESVSEALLEGLTKDCCARALEVEAREQLLGAAGLGEGVIFLDETAQLQFVRLVPRQQ